MFGRRVVFLVVDRCRSSGARLAVNVIAAENRGSVVACSVYRSTCQRRPLSSIRFLTTSKKDTSEPLPQASLPTPAPPPPAPPAGDAPPDAELEGQPPAPEQDSTDDGDVKLSGAFLRVLRVAFASVLAIAFLIRVPGFAGGAADHAVMLGKAKDPFLQRAACSRIAVIAKTGRNAAKAIQKGAATELVQLAIRSISDPEVQAAALAALAAIAAHDAFRERIISAGAPAVLATIEADTEVDASVQKQARALAELLSPVSHVLTDVTSQASASLHPAPS